METYHKIEKVINAWKTKNMKEALNQTQLASRLKMIRQQVTEKIKRQPLFYQSVLID